MQWTADVSTGAWLRPRIDDPWQGTMHDVVPRGFDAYARIFHPASRERPVGTQWPREAYTDHRAWDAFFAAHPDLETITERVSWTSAAAALGTTMHAGAQWGTLARFDPRADRENDPRDADGWRYHDPETGGMPPDVLATIATVLARHTTTADAGVVALWEGHGGLLGHLGRGPSRGFYQSGPDGMAILRHNEMLSTSISDRFNSVFRRPTWQEGILSREISQAPRFELPARAHVLFRGGVAELARPDWELDVPWRDRISEAHGAEPSALTPSLIWPDDHAWVLVTEVDFDSTIVAGSAELIGDICADPALEAVRIPEGTALSWDSDEVNG